MATALPATFSALHGITVLDLGGELTNYCGRMFAQLGAEVILVEPVQGSSYRESMPRALSNDESLRFAYDNSDKRSIGIDFSTAQGKEVFQRLLAKADLLLDDQTHHDLRTTGFDYASLSQKYPHVVRTVITPFGLQGPYSSYQATDATLMAFGGMLWLGGYDEGAPVQAAGHQAFRAGNLFGAVASMAALLDSTDHPAEWIDVSVQECVSLGLENAIQFYDLEGHVRRRHGGKQKQAGFGVFPCADGYVVLIAGGIGGNRFWTNFTSWLKDEKVQDAETLEETQWWQREFVETTEAKNEFWEIFTQYSLRRTKEELLEKAFKWNVPLSPVKTVSEVHRSEQLAARDFFSTITIGEHTAVAPGAPYQLEKTPWRTAHPAPKIGQHTDLILKQLGFTDDEVHTMRSRKEVS